jgi:hypothetical protein
MAKKINKTGILTDRKLKRVGNITDELITAKNNNSCNMDVFGYKDNKKLIKVNIVRYRI